MQPNENKNHEIQIQESEESETTRSQRDYSSKLRQHLDQIDELDGQAKAAAKDFKLRIYRLNQFPRCPLSTERWQPADK